MPIKKQSRLTSRNDRGVTGRRTRLQKANCVTKSDAVGLKLNMYKCMDALIPYDCTCCPSFQTNSLVHLRRHIHRGHKREELHEKQYKCKQCPFETFSQYLSLKHQKCVNCASTNSEDRVKAETINDGWQSKRCILKLEEKKLDHHKCSNAQSEENIFKCKECPSQFKTRKGLKLHINSRHTDPKNINWHKCANCKCKFKHKDSLTRHMFFQHTDLKDEDIQWYKCTICSFKCRQEHGLNRHIIRQHSNLQGEEMKWFQCARCSSVFIQEQDLNGHINSQHIDSKVIYYYECVQLKSEKECRMNLRCTDREEIA